MPSKIRVALALPWVHDSTVQPKYHADTQTVNGLTWHWLVRHAIARVHATRKPCRAQAIEAVFHFLQLCVHCVRVGLVQQCEEGARVFNIFNCNASAARMRRPQTILYVCLRRS